MVPAAYDPSAQWPVLFGFHGLDGEYTYLLDDAGLRTYADELGVILAMPQALDLGGTVGWDAFSDEGSNRDLLLFDDMLTCLKESFSIDASRLWVTGMSSGGHHPRPVCECAAQRVSVLLLDRRGLRFLAYRTKNRLFQTVGDSVHAPSVAQYVPLQ